MIELIYEVESIGESVTSALIPQPMTNLATHFTITCRYSSFHLESLTTR